MQVLNLSIKTLTKIHKEWNEKHKTDSPITGANIDDIIWYAKAQGIKHIGVLPSQLNPIWQFLSADMGNSDTEMRRQYFIEGKCDKILGVKIKILPYSYEIFPPEDIHPLTHDKH